MPITLYSSWRDAGVIPADWRPMDPPGHVEKRPVKNLDALQALRNAKPGTWVKVYRKGKDGHEVHYFEHKSGTVASVKMKYRKQP